MSISLPLHKKLGKQWIMVSYRFVIVRPVLRLDASMRHKKQMPAYTLRRWGTERQTKIKIKWGSFFDVRKVNQEHTRKNIRQETRCVRFR